MLHPDATPSAAGSLTTPVLLLIFNRPSTTQQVLEALRRAQPARLYVAADGPRPDRPTDAALCQETRQLVLNSIDWPCEVHTLFQPTNLNCGVGPATAISWFFRHEAEGIILEDDCVPTGSFFPFCQEMLARYRHDTRIMHIGGNNFGAPNHVLRPEEPSYYFSSQVNSWGWATWRRAWQLYDFHLTDFERIRSSGSLSRAYSSGLEARYRLAKIAGVMRLSSPPHVWDYQWHFAVAAHSGLCIVPATNLVGNIGFGAAATHTHDAEDDFAAVPTQDLLFPLQHPLRVLRDHRRDQYQFRRFLLGRVQAIGRRWLRRLVPRLPTPSASPASPALSASVPAHLSVSPANADVS
ncbi:nucleotide-diphospho-sugar transferase [Hymenobacter sediminis]|uniref:nucleotide-diphospho-sugar transferase n=1 Tax=Hymenobacter sediminis TaxID=2218621 RepID=UPI000DA69239|nr:nucleotide-diphospho-sugar transferase [Hymenobacter sediminis]RPD44968.1 nucleotide-diphospho-sugar transferase [Hymenobacter sediminis]